ncbi:MAG: DUF3098 domain-containing protein [Rikenellaceae bacterium]
MERREETPQESQSHDLPLATANYKILLLGFALIVLGFVLMTGGASDDPNVFSYEIFSWRRITLAPIVVVVGFIVEIYAIMKR